jgi:hypothetical protein
MTYDLFSIIFQELNYNWLFPDSFLKIFNPFRNRHLFFGFPKRFKQVAVSILKQSFHVFNAFAQLWEQLSLYLVILNLLLIDFFIDISNFRWNQFDFITGLFKQNIIIHIVPLNSVQLEPKKHYQEDGADEDDDLDPVFRVEHVQKLVGIEILTSW